MRLRAVLIPLLWALTHVNAEDLLVLTVATERNDALERLLRSAHHNNFDVKVLGLGTSWKGGDVSKFVGGGQKVKLLREELER
ncbi:uncharacterized protein DEA37_0008586, partial [Paragonimus westermani]